MGFLSNFARKLVNKTDEEAIRLISRAQGGPPEMTAQPAPVGTELPPPRRLDPAATAANIPPPTALQPPTRMAPVEVDAPPPALTRNESNLEKMEETLRAQPWRDYSNATVGAGGGVEGIRFPTMAPNVPMPTRTPMIEPAAEPAAPAFSALGPPNRVTVGETYDTGDPVSRARAKLQALQGASPMSKVKDTGSGYEVLPPGKLGRGRGAWEGFKQTMSAGAQYGLGGLIGAGTVGALTGAISPGSIQNRGREMEIAGAESQLGRAQELQGRDLQNEARQIKNLQDLAELGGADGERNLKVSQEQRVEWAQGLDHLNEMQKATLSLDPKSQQYSAAQKAIEQEAERLSRRTGRKVTVIPGNPSINQLPKMEIDGQIVQQQYDGTWKPVYGTSRSASDAERRDLESTYEWRVKSAENEGKRTAALSEATALEATAADHQRKVTTIAGEISKLDAQMKDMSPRDPALGPMKRQRQQLEAAQKNEQDGMDRAYLKANELKAEANKYPALPPPPKRRAAAQQGGNMSLSKSAWLKANPGGDWSAAEAEAAKRKIPIIP